MLRRSLFVLAHCLQNPSFKFFYDKAIRNQWESYAQLKLKQEFEMRKIILYSYDNVPYYRKLFDKIHINPNDIRYIEDLEHLPILSKDEIKNHWDEFKPKSLHRINYYDQATGGSTGTPFNYRLCKIDRFLSGALLYRGWGYAGYRLGDKMAFLGGSSLDIGTKSNMLKYVHEITRNIKKLSSFDMSNGEMEKYKAILFKIDPKYLRGYASSIYFFANWIEKNDLKMISPSAIFTTSEMLYPFMREKIENVFSCDVYNNYGLNDGGLGAYECPMHCGMHIDTERSIMEIVDNNGDQLDCGEGRILATSLYNYAMPFIRYDTGDIGEISDEECSCGRGHKLLKNLTGRSVDYLITPEGKNIHGWFFLYIFWEVGRGIKEYQVVQENINTLVIKIVPEESFNPEQLNKIRKLISLRSPKWNIEFLFEDTIQRTKAGKYKFVINKMS